MFKRTATIAAATATAAALSLPVAASASAAPTSAPAPAAADSVSSGLAHAQQELAASGNTVGVAQVNQIMAATQGGQALDATPAEAQPAEALFQIPGFPLNGAKRLDGSPITVTGRVVTAVEGATFSADIIDIPGTFEGSATAYWINLATLKVGQAPMTYTTTNTSPRSAFARSADFLDTGSGPVVAAIVTRGDLVPSAGQSTPYISTPSVGFFQAQ